ncbi:MAG: thermonuclease family protein, partial [Eubacteriales bacterium]
KVLSPEKLLLNNDLEIKMIGIKTKKGFEQHAIDFLFEKFEKRKIYFKYDKEKYDSDNCLMCYVYLDNKTFINNHLARTGFVDIDKNMDFKYKNKFMEALKNG